MFSGWRGVHRASSAIAGSSAVLGEDGLSVRTYTENFFLHTSTKPWSHGPLPGDLGGGVGSLRTGPTAKGDDAASMKRTRADARGAVIVQDAVEEGVCQMKHWPGNNNIADIFTKWLPRNEFQRYRSMLLNLPAQRKLGLPVDG